MFPTACFVCCMCVGAVSCVWVLCVYVMCVCVCVLCVCVCRPEEDVRCLLHHLIPYSFEIGSLTDPGICYFSDRQTGQQPQRSFSPPFKCWRHRCTWLYPLFKWGSSLRASCVNSKNSYSLNHVPRPSCMLLIFLAPLMGKWSNITESNLWMSSMLKCVWVTDTMKVLSFYRGEEWRKEGCS